jgi:hypothetical protein
VPALTGAGMARFSFSFLLLRPLRRQQHHNTINRSSRGTAMMGASAQSGKPELELELAAGGGGGGRNDCTFNPPA